MLPRCCTMQRRQAALCCVAPASLPLCCTKTAHIPVVSLKVFDSITIILSVCSTLDHYHFCKVCKPNTYKKTRTLLHRAHTSTKAADPAIFLQLNTMWTYSGAESYTMILASWCHLIQQGITLTPPNHNIMQYIFLPEISWFLLWPMCHLSIDFL